MALVKDAMTNLPGSKRDEVSVLDVLDLMRNHVDDTIANGALDYLLKEHDISFQIYIFVSA